MALFKRNKKESILPEVDKYYEGERRDRTGLAWVLALVSVVVVALFIVALFLSGRWVYREIFGDDQEVAVVEETGQQEAPSFDGGSTEEGSEQNNTESNSDQNQPQANNEGSSPAPENTNTPSTQEEGNVDAPARTETPSTTTPTTGDDPLPSTGPANMIGMFVGVSAIAGGIHYVVSRRRQVQ